MTKTINFVYNNKEGMTKMKKSIISTKIDENGDTAAP